MEVGFALVLTLCRARGGGVVEGRGPDVRLGGDVLPVEVVRGGSPWRLEFLKLRNS